MNPMQAPVREALADRAAAQTQREQLPPSHHPMLPTRQLRDRRVDFCRYSRSFSTHPTIVARKVLQG
jgi:hypothetical protein